MGLSSVFKQCTVQWAASPKQSFFNAHESSGLSSQSLPWNNFTEDVYNKWQRKTDAARITPTPPQILMHRRFMDPGLLNIFQSSLFKNAFCNEESFFMWNGMVGTGFIRWHGAMCSRRWSRRGQSSVTDHMLCLTKSQGSITIVSN